VTLCSLEVPRPVRPTVPKEMLSSGLGMPLGRYFYCTCASARSIHERASGHGRTVSDRAQLRSFFGRPTLTPSFSKMLSVTMKFLVRIAPLAAFLFAQEDVFRS